MSRSRPVVAVIGAGPRGLAVLGRLLAHLGPGGSWAGTGADLHVIEPQVPGAGRVWSPDQPEALLMNTLAGHATAYPDDSVRMAGPALTGPGLLEWSRERGSALAPWEHPGRALMGRYLAWVYEDLSRRAPDGVRVVPHRTRATALERVPGGVRVHLESGAPAVTADAVVLATGHTDQLPGARERELSRFAEHHGLVHLRPGYPHEAALDRLEPGATVLVRGLALNFFDQLTLLTAGRGGRFTQNPDGSARYLPSGREPRLIAGSGRGVPYLARGQAPGAMPRGHRPRYFDAERAGQLAARGPGRVDFRTEVWPLIAREVGAAWYEVALRLRPGMSRLPRAEFLERYGAVEHGSPRWAALLAEAFPDPADRFDPAALDRPLAGRVFPDRQALGSWMRRFLRADLAAARDPERSPLKAAAAAIAATKAQVRRVAVAGVLNAAGPRELRWFRGFGAHTASGPPASRIAELLALHEAGVVEFAGAGLTVDTDGAAGLFTGESPTVGGEKVQAGALLDAWLPGADLATTGSALLASLAPGGLARPHRAGAGDTAVPTGAVDVDPVTLRVRDAAGVPQPDLFACGIPLEGIEWNTAIGARAGGNAALFRQADTVAHGMLTAAAGPYARR
ncbi:FAD/NAD(P)-binding protein [Streptomyces xiamenensis]|uniref:FAD/NAD(P)-binding protein n=1 Tax=Streptomyces xiamenensis TaxID=408015 RepID=UPI003D7354A9